jgi:plastocyanin
MTRISIVTIGLLVAFSAREAATQPTKVKARAATQADIERLEKKIADQQRVLERLVKLQQQYLSQVIAILPDPGTATQVSAVVEADPEPPKVDPKVSPEAKLEKALAKVTEPKPRLEPARVAPPPVKKAGKGIGTIVGKVKGGTGDVYVYVEDIVAPTSGSAQMKQEGKQFVPRVLAVQKGTKVEFPNRDAVFHNVFSVSPENTFDLGSYRQGETKGVTMARPGVVNVYCNMHPQMVGYILVVPSSLYVRAGADGFYRLPNVPSGKHRIVAWAPNAKPVVSEVEVPDDEVVTVELEVKKGRALPHTNKDNMPYGSYKD